MTTKSIFWSLQNGGDGSAYPYFFESKELAEWDQENMDEGWGEPCCGEITVRGDNVEFVEPSEVHTRFTMLGTLLFQYNGRLVEDRDLKKVLDFVKKFFPEGVPDMYATVYDEQHYGIYVENSCVPRTCICKIWDHTITDAGLLLIGEYVEKAHAAIQAVVHS